MKKATIAETLWDFRKQAHIYDVRPYVEQIEAVASHAHTLAVLRQLENALPTEFSLGDDDNPGFSGGWHLDTYKLAIEDCRMELKAAIADEQHHAKSVVVGGGEDGV